MKLRRPGSVEALEELGRTRLSPNFFMRDFLYSEIANFYGIPNIPDDPELAIEAGKRLCEELLEPLRERVGCISIRSAFRSAKVNEQGVGRHRCGGNEGNYAGHIWDHKDANGEIGATACIVVHSFLDYYEKTGHWQALAWFVHDHLPGHAGLEFFSNLAAFNISWHERPTPNIKSYIPPTSGRWLTKPGMDNFEGTHEDEYRDWLTSAGIS